jgi:hypothetical protein
MNFMNERMPKTDRFHYVACPKHKSRPKKHVLVCRECRWRRNCRAYLAYCQPGLPFVFSRPA